MLDARPRDRYSRSNILNFVAKQSHLREAKVNVPDEFFSNAPGQPEGPVDLLYCYDGTQAERPALGFQQVDTEQDEEEMYALVYLDPAIQESWHAQMKHV